MQLLAHVLDVGLLIHMGSLSRYRNGSAGGRNLSTFLYQNLLEQSGEIINKASGFAQYFGGPQVIQRGRLLHAIGGISMRFVEQLVQLFWRDRKLFLAVLVHMGPCRRSSSIFFVLALCCFVKGYAFIDCNDTCVC